MKWLQPSELPRQEFEGRTPEEAIANARRELGDEAALRCWKTRRGGVCGFFARETFVAGITPPPSLSASVTAVGQISGLEPTGASESSHEDWTAQLLTYAGRSTIADLLDETVDQVTIGFQPFPETFRQVLSEAEAALNTGNVVAMEARPTDAETILLRRSFEGRESIPGFLSSLEELGVPAQHCPAAGDATLDGLLRSLSGLSTPLEISSAGGSTIAVVGGEGEAEQAARAVLRTLNLEPSRAIVPGRSESGRLQVVFRQCAKKISVVIVEAPLRSPDMAEALAWMRELQPDYVLGAVPATSKRSDVVKWCDQVGRVDALAIAHLADTATPGELIGVLPIAYLDGMPATPLRWVTILLGALIERDS